MHCLLIFQAYILESYILVSIHAYRASAMQFRCIGATFPIFFLHAFRRSQNSRNLLIPSPTNWKKRTPHSTSHLPFHSISLCSFIIRVGSWRSRSVDVFIFFPWCGIVDIIMFLMLVVTGSTFWQIGCWVMMTAPATRERKSYIIIKKKIFQFSIAGSFLLIFKFNKYYLSRYLRKQ